MLPLWPPLDRPAFIIGCGRSGTTILGTVLAHHPLVTYLNEPRDLWIRVLPEADVWSAKAAVRGGRLELDAAACRLLARWRFRWRLARAVRRTGRPRLVEKLPINAFRLPFILAAVPEARFVHLVRDGRAVARSIARRCAQEVWYGVDDYKFRLLAERAERDPETRALPARCHTPFERGLLEWRLSEEAALAFFAAHPDVPCLDVRYEAFVEAPARELARIETFLELPPSVEAHALADREVRERHRAPQDLSPDVEAIGGPLLRRLGYLAEG